MNRIVLYYHAGSKNHGCEAIVRSTEKILKRELDLYSFFPEEDYLYNLNEKVSIFKDEKVNLKNRSIKYLFAAIMHYIREDDYFYTILSHEKFFNTVNKGDIYMSIGGDNYCYKGKDILGYYNKQLHKKRAKTVLWGCSVETKEITAKIAKDLALYDLIIARECISYEVLKKINPHTILLPDPAFQLESEELPLPNGWITNHMVGINISPLIEKYGNEALIIDNFRELVKYILIETNESIVLIPHVVKENDDDRKPLRKLFNEFKETGRVILLEDYNCMQVKGYISRCRFFVGARTHATIAAYSSSVPTLAVGYSVKAIGIARELFETDEHFVIPVQNLKTESSLKEEFQWLMKNETNIRLHLDKIIPEYKNRLLDVCEILNSL